MKKISLLLSLLVLTIPWLTAGDKSVGGGVSVFLPETLLTKGYGTVAFEQGLSTSLGLGDYISVPVGFVYQSVDGFRLEHSGATDVDRPAFYGDSLIPYVDLKVHVPLGSILYVEAFGGGALDWAFSLSPTEAFSHTIPRAAGAVLQVEDVTIKKGLGYGWQAGGALGVKVGAISVDLGGTYRWLTIPIDVTTKVTDGSGNSSVVSFDSARAILRGVSIRLGGSYAF